MINRILRVSKILSIGILFFSLGEFSIIFSYTSDMLKSNEGEKVNYYYARHIEKLRKSIKPRFIHVIDSRGFSDKHSILQSGVLFTYKNYQAKDVKFLSNVDRYQKHKMMRNEKGVWYYILPQKEFDEKKPDREILYKFVVDGLFVHDTTHENYDDDNAGGYLSRFVFTNDMFKPHEGVLVLKSDTPNNKKVVFRVYAPDAKFISLMGSFNNWDSEIDVMQKTEDGFFEIEKSLSVGEYTYLLRVDGVTMVDQKSAELKYHPVFSKVGYFKVN